ncbi:MAG: hypothetical protein WCJ14_06395 [Verrucomicrobiota bacterium]
MKHKTMLVAAMAAFCCQSLALAAPKATSPATAGAEAPKSTTAAAPNTPAKTVAYPLTGTVVAISATELTIKGGEGKPDRVYAMTPQTVIVNGDKPAKIDEVKVGQKVGGRLEKSTAGHDKVLKLNLGVKQESQSKPKSK